jgi:hypothetical protein
MSKKSIGDKKLEMIIDNVHKQIEHYEAVNKEKMAEIENNNSMIKILKQQLESIEDMCKGVDDDMQKNKTHASGSKAGAGESKEV